MSAEGFRLVIPQEMLNRLQKADERLEQLGRTSENTQQKVIASFRAMADGINPFIQKLNEAQQALANIGNHKGGNINLGNVSIQATQAADDVNKLVDVIAKLYAENEKIKNQQLSSRGITIAQEGQLSKKQSAARYKELQNEEREYMNFQRERERELMRADKNAQRRHVEEMARIKEQIRERQRLTRLTTTPSVISGKQVGTIIGNSNSAVTINQMITSIKNLEKAKRDLDTTDKNYKKTLKEIDNAINKNKQSLRKLGVETENVRKHQSNLMNHAQQLRRALALVFSVSQIAGYVNKMIQIRGEFELQQRSLQAILQNKDEANRIWQQTVDLAVRSPFRVKELVTYTKQLAAYRVETEKLHETTRMLSDVSAGLGVDMQRLILAYGQVKAANYLRGTELRQFSEAGINILGELSKYFTELEGRAISVGEVFERVSKRMVSFGDVEEIFKRITSEGGIFYRMQEIQSETVKGLISNLYDQIDLMFNDIGKSNDGALKGAIGLVKEFVENWREVAFVLEKVGYSLLAYTAVTKLAQLGTSKMAQTFLNFTGITAQSVKSLNLFQKTLTGIGMLGAGAVLAGLIYGFLEIWRVSTKASREAERLQKELQEIYRTDYSEFKQQTKTFNELVEKLKDVNQGSEEHREIIQKLNSQYGEYLGFVVTEATTYDKLRSSIDGVNQALLRKAKMSTYEKAYTKIFDETNKTIDQGIEKLKSDIKRVTVTKGGSMVLPTEDEINDVVKILENRLKSLGKRTPLWSDVQEAFKEYGLEVEQIRGWSNRTLLDWKNALITQKEAELKLEQQINAQYSDTTAKTIEHRNALKQIDEIEKNRLEKAKKQGDTSSIAYKKEVDRIKKEAQISRIQAQVQYEGLDKDVADKRIAELNKFSDTVIDINNKIEASVGKLGEKYANIIYIDEAEAETGISKIAESAAQSYKTMQDVIKQQNALKKAGTVHDQDILENAEKTAAAYYYKLQLLGRLDLLQEKTTNGSNKELQLLNKQLSALKESKQTFDQLRHKFGLEEATKRTAKAFEDLFEELDMTEFTIDMTFDNQGIIDVINEFPNKAGEAGKQAMEKLKAEMAGGIDVDVKVREDEDLLRQIENMFSGYELSLELEKLNIPPDLAKQLFNVDSISLPELKAQLVGMESQFVGTDMEKQYRDYLQKVSKMEQEAQEERLKRYAKFLTKGFNERINLKIKELRELELLEKDKEKLAPQQYEAAKKGIQDEYNTKILKQEWEEFEKSSQYLNLFDDIKNSSNAALRSMLSHLESLKQSMIAAGLPASDLKEILNQIEKVEEELEERTPFATFNKDLGTAVGKIGEYIKARKEEKKLLKDIENLRKKEKELAPQVAEEQDNAKNNPLYQTMLAAQKHLATLEEGTQEYEIQEKAVKALYEAVYPVTTEHQEITEQIDETNQELDDAQSKTNKWKEALKGVGNGNVKFGGHLKEVGSFVSDMAQKWEQAFGLSDRAREDMETIANVAQSAGEMAVGIGKAIANPADIGAYMQAASGLMGILATFGQAHDKEKERQIEREIKLVERLQKVYEDLGDTIKNAYSIDTLNEATQMSRENIMAQIEATNRMIEAEKGKKDTDWERIEDWKEDIEELEDAMKELEETRLQELGAFASDENKKSGAEAFLDAWMEAYKQTGDGLSGLNEQFDEFFEDMIKKQLLQRASNKYLQEFYEVFDRNIRNWADNEISGEDAINNILKAKDEYMPQLNEWLKRFADSLGVAEDLAGSTAELSGLQAGKQGITEDQADVLASYMNSLRFYVADNNDKFTDLITRLFDSEGGSNPMLAELRAQTAFIREIRDSLGGVIRGGHSMGGDGLKVFVS